MSLTYKQMSNVVLGLVMSRHIENETSVFKFTIQLESYMINSSRKCFSINKIAACIVDWGDKTSTIVETVDNPYIDLKDINHTYTKVGIYHITITSLNNSISTIRFSDDNPSTIKPIVLSIDLIQTRALTSCNSMFNGCSSLTSVPWFNTSKVTDMYYMFGGCSSLSIVPQLDTSKVTTMKYMFLYCTSLVSVPQFDYSNVLYFTSMFYGCSKLTQCVTIPPSTLSYTNNRDYMYTYCSSLVTVNINMKNTISMNGIFRYCTSLNTVQFNNMNNIVDANNVFENCNQLQTVSGFGLNCCYNLQTTFRYTGILHQVLFTGQLWNANNTSIDLSTCALTHEGLLNIFNSLPTKTSQYYTATLTITGVNNEDELLTTEERLIVTNKGWTLA